MESKYGETGEQEIKQITEDELSVAKQSFVAADDEDFENSGVGRRRKLLVEQLSQLEEEEEEEEDDKLCREMDKNNKNPNEEIIKELKNIKRQNLITHCLVSAMLVVTVAWQISEVSLILKIKNGLSNPLKFIGGIIRGLMLKGGPQVNVEEAMKQVSTKQIEPTFLPGIKLPELPFLDLPMLDSSDED